MATSEDGNNAERLSPVEMKEFRYLSKALNSAFHNMIVALNLGKAVVGPMGCYYKKYSVSYDSISFRQGQLVNDCEISLSGQKMIMQANTQAYYQNNIPTYFTAQPFTTIVNNQEVKMHGPVRLSVDAAGEAQLQNAILKDSISLQMNNFNLNLKSGDTVTLDNNILIEHAAVSRSQGQVQQVLATDGILYTTAPYRTLYNNGLAYSFRITQPTLKAVGPHKLLISDNILLDKNSGALLLAKIEHPDNLSGKKKFKEAVNIKIKAKTYKIMVAFYVYFHPNGEVRAAKVRDENKQIITVYFDENGNSTDKKGEDLWFY